MGCHFLLQRIFLTQESNLGLLHCRQILYRLSYEGSGKQQMSYIDRKRSLDSSTLSQCTHSLTTSTQLAACPLPVSFKKRHSGTSLALQWLTRHVPFRGIRSIPGWVTQISHASRCGQKNNMINLRMSERQSPELVCPHPSLAERGNGGTYSGAALCPGAPRQVAAGQGPRPAFSLAAGGPEEPLSVGGDGFRHRAGRAAPRAGVEGPRPLLSPHSASFGLGSAP